jgi:hypothetical protein
MGGGLAFFAFFARELGATGEAHQLAARKMDPRFRGDDDLGAAMVAGGMVVGAMASGWCAGMGWWLCVLRGLRERRSAVAAGRRWDTAQPGRTRGRYQ